MRNYKKYRSVTIDLFKLFLAEKLDKEGLIKGLQAIESIIKQGKISNKSIWFRFFKGDCLATTISNIHFDLERSNDNYIKECMQIAVNNPKGLQIHFS